jgi:hypothetical protein
MLGMVYSFEFFDYNFKLISSLGLLPQTPIYFLP